MISGNYINGTGLLRSIQGAAATCRAHGAGGHRRNPLLSPCAWRSISKVLKAKKAHIVNGVLRFSIATPPGGHGVII